MSYPPDEELDVELPALFGGVPAVIKFISGEMVVAVVLYDEEQDVYIFDRPLIVNVRHDPDDETLAIMRFERWVPLSASLYYAVYTDLILNMTVVAQPLISKYFKWADTLYPMVEEDTSAPLHTDDAEPSPVFVKPDTSLTEAQRELHYMHLMMTHVPKTSPN